jgi:hypothetical protein
MPTFGNPFSTWGRTRSAWILWSVQIDIVTLLSIFLEIFIIPISMHGRESNDFPDTRSFVGDSKWPSVLPNRYNLHSEWDIIFQCKPDRLPCDRYVLQWIGLQKELGIEELSGLLWFSSSDYVPGFFTIRETRPDRNNTSMKIYSASFTCRGANYIEEIMKTKD